MKLTRLFEKGASAAVAAVAFSRFWAYSPLASPPYEASGPLFLSGGGQFLLAYALAWLVIGVLAVVDIVYRDTGWTEPLFVGLMAVWGGSYLLAWMQSGYSTEDWMTFALYAGFSFHVLFKYLETSRLLRIIAINNEQGHLVATGTIPIPVKTEDGEVIEDSIRVRMEVRGDD